mmetsp:Transcript_107721/g.246734  ORF Transcript_107721/g.246734 Transcript_107721/m.246734 type:complete len:522 (-) Transcript_107721:68-1633(-)
MRVSLLQIILAAGQQAGVLTAGDIDDNLNFEFYLGFNNRTHEGIETQESNFVAPDLSDRIVVKVQDSTGAHFPCAAVTASAADTTAILPAGTNGLLYLFPTLDGLSSTALTLTAVPPGGCSGQCVAAAGQATAAGDEVTLVIAGAAAGLPQAMDVVFVIDTTGSMGDELSYLQTEFSSVFDRVKEDNPQVSIRIGLVLYRDQGDAYVTRTFGLSDAISTRAADLNEQTFDGGGDFPEAMFDGMQAGLEMEWREGNTARVMFVVADAPPKPGTYAQTVQVAKTARSKGIAILGLAASGVDGTAEYLMRLFAAVTGGRHLFLTDDSGVGNSHQEPTIRCYQVTRLDSLLVRVLKSQLLGERVEPSAPEILREVGRQERGVCIIDITTTTTTTTMTAATTINTATTVVSSMSAGMTITEAGGSTGEAPDETDVSFSTGFTDDFALGFGMETASGFGMETASGFGMETASGFGMETASGFGMETASGFGMETASGFGMEASGSGRPQIGMVLVSVTMFWGAKALG